MLAPATERGSASQSAGALQDFLDLILDILDYPCKPGNSKSRKLPMLPFLESKILAWVSIRGKLHNSADAISIPADTEPVVSLL